jgi:hypothetical protein
MVKSLLVFVSALAATASAFSPMNTPSTVSSMLLESMIHLRYGTTALFER